MTRFPAVLLVIVMLAAMATMPSNAGAATWTSDKVACGGWGYSERGSGQMDAAGRLYVPCSVHDNGQHYNHVQVYSPSGVRIQQIPLRFPENPNGTDRASDVAPSPDGSYLYVIHYARYTAYRFNRQADGSYVADPNWRLANYPHRHGGTARPLGQFLATDGNGDIYFSSGLWACNVECTDDAIVKYGPAGNVITRFGEKVGGSWALGHSHGSFGGLAVTADGSRVFVADINNSRVQRFDRGAGGTYGAVLAMGMDQYSDPNRWGACYGDGRLAGAYDVTMSPRGELLVINTTCFSTATFHAYMPYGTIEVQRFGQDGSARGSVIARSHYDTRVHGIAIDRVGNVHLVQAKAVLRPPADWSDQGADVGGGGPMGGAAPINPAPQPEPQPEPQPQPQPEPTPAPQPAPAAPAPANPAPADPAPADPAPAAPDPAAPGPDVDGGGAVELPRPRITVARMPVQVFRGRRIAVRVRARGQSPVTLVRFSTTGRWSKWQRLRGRNFVYLPRGTGWKGVLVQVRDTAGTRSVPWFQPVLMGPRGTRWVKGTSGTNRLRGSRRSEHFESTQFDRRRDVINCGGGWDTVYAQPEDLVARNCERVIRVKLPRW